MNKNGFVFVETIIAIIVLSSSLLLLYTSFAKILQSEKTRTNYDDIAYIYRTYYIKNKLNELNMDAVFNDISIDENKYFVTVGIEYDMLFKKFQNEKNYVSSMFEDFEVSQIVVFKQNKLDNLKKCTYECSNDYNCKSFKDLSESQKQILSDNCNRMYTNLSDEFINYLKTIYVDVSCTYVMAIEYNTCTGSNGNDNCKRYYSWVSV